MKAIRSILAGALLATVATAGQAAPISLTQSHGGTSLSSAGSTFTHMLALTEVTEGQALLSLSFDVSKNAAAQNDTISLFLDGSLQASGRASSFAVTNLDVSEFFDFTTGTLTFQLFRGVSVGGGNIKLRHSELVVPLPGGIAGVASTDSASEQQYGGAMQISERSAELQMSALRELPEPGTLALLGVGVLGMTMLRRRPA
ncbi:MAG: PEP-CTERM sorting domain-containing protein [Azoarcus sp.]|nr:PEP-CTERM sorting domain-containing protein [Azoarcus sp.]